MLNLTHPILPVPADIGKGQDVSVAVDSVEILRFYRATLLALSFSHPCVGLTMSVRKTKLTFRM